MNNPLVSVIIPTHEGADSLPRAIDSVMAQTYQNLEIIVVDDNGLGTYAQKNTEQVVKPYLVNSKVQYICHEVNMNGAVARNTGARHATGNYISLLDDDDYFLPDNIENHMKAWEHLDDSYGLTYCDVEKHNPNGNIIVAKKTFCGQDLYKLMMHDLVIGSSTMVVRKSVWDELGGFDESFRRHQDYEFSARLMAKYKVWATQTLGDCYIIQKRHSAKNTSLAIEYRRHFLNKMVPVMSSLPVLQRKRIVAWNIVEAAWPFLENKQYGQFVKVMMNNHQYIWGIWAIYNRMLHSFRCRIQKH